MRLLKRIAVGAVALVVLLVSGVFGVSAFRMAGRVEVTEPAPAIVHDSTTVARGQYLATAIAKCAECHGDDFGGKLAIDAGPVATIYAPNLTRGRGGIGGVRSDEDIVRAVRHAVGPEGRKLVFMPAVDWVEMADADMSAIVSYVRSLPPVDREIPAPVVKPLGRALYVAGQFPMFDAELIDHAPRTRPTVTPGVTVEYGRYLAAIGGCTGCHGPTLSGGRLPGTPPEIPAAANLTPEGIGHYTEADFFKALREGVRPDGSRIDPFMPVKYTKLMTDDDTRAIRAYLQTVPKKAFGGR